MHSWQSHSPAHYIEGISWGTLVRAVLAKGKGGGGHEDRQTDRAVSVYGLILLMWKNKQTFK